MSAPTRYCECGPEARPVEHGAGGWLLCERCGEALRPKLERLVVRLGREVLALRRRVERLEGPITNETNGNGRSPTEPPREQLSLEDVR